MRIIPPESSARNSGYVQAACIAGQNPTGSLSARFLSNYFFCDEPVLVLFLLLHQVCNILINIIIKGLKDILFAKAITGIVF